MRSIICFISTCVTLSSAAIADDIPPEPVDGKIQWVYSYDEGKKLAKVSGKPMFVVFRCER